MFYTWPFWAVTYYVILMLLWSTCWPTSSIAQETIFCSSNNLVHLQVASCLLHKSRSRRFWSIEWTEWHCKPVLYTFHLDLHLRSCPTQWINKANTLLFSTTWSISWITRVFHWPGVRANSHVRLPWSHFTWSRWKVSKFRRGDYLCYEWFTTL